MHKAKERDGAASPGPAYMSPAQMTNYLHDLRTNRPSRPVGSRPPPAHFNTWSSRASAKFVDTPPVSPLSEPTAKAPEVQVEEVPPTPPEPATKPKGHHRSQSSMTIDEILAGYGGRALVQPPRGRDTSTASSSRERTPSVQYRESGRRQVEREQAHELRVAMEQLDVKQEEELYTAARDEAAELVFKHRNPNAPGNNPDAPYVYPGLARPGLTRKGSHQRTQSLGPSGEQDLQRSQSKLRKRNSMGSATSGSRSSSLQSHGPTSPTSSVEGNAGFSTSPTKGYFENKDTTQASAAPEQVPSIPAKSERRRSSGSRRKASGSLFKNPADQIYEEPEEENPAPVPAVAPAISATPAPAKLPLQVRRNPFSRVQFARDNNLVRSNTDPVLATKRFDRFEIHKNPPTQSRNAAYTANIPVPKPTEEPKSDVENDPEVKIKDGKEIRSDDIRAATGFRLKDRSAKLPTPTAVSDSPGRPIVSFQKGWKAVKEIELKEEISSIPPPATAGRFTQNSQLDQVKPIRPLSHAATEPVVPTINFPDDSSRRMKPTAPSPIPQISVNATPAPAPRNSRSPLPTISIYEDPPARPLPNAAFSRKVNTPPTAAPSIPTINVSQTPPTRSKPSPAPPIPTISVQETPSISVSPADRGGVKPLSISVTPIPTISINEPSAPIPTINAPSISVTPSVPSINVNGPPTSTRPLPNPKNHTSRPFPRNNTSNTTTSRSHRTPTSVRTGVLCQQCALPIAGRIVSAAGARFHPECFLCHHCGEGLECVAFYPEPDNKLTERVARIRARQRGEDIEFLPTHPTHEDMMRLEEEDGIDEGMRFYCHLDFHEFFSPRCKSCKTPIEGEVVVACGAEWHVGHFFCAQCGDPFDSSTPFVEKDGYAWCVGCHTNRYSTKCRKCRKPVTDTVVKALGAEWHVGCFVCMECSGPFEDGRYFLRGESQDPVCVRCEEKRLKA